MNKKRPLVLWSGGFDSTVLVIDKLADGDIDIMYVDLENNKRAQRREKKAIAKIKLLIKDANLKGKIIYEYDFGYQRISASKAVYAQPALWLQAVTFCVDPERHSEVLIAYVKGDDVWHYKHQIKKVYKTLLALTCHDDDVVPLKFPLEWNTKANLLEWLGTFVYNKQVLNLIYYCEAGWKEPCGECTSCKRHIQEVDVHEDGKMMAIDMSAEFAKFQKEKEVCHDS